VDDPDVWEVRDLALMATGAFEAAEDSCRRGLGLDPDHVGLLLGLAECLEAQSRESEAEHVLIALLNQRPDNERALTRYAWLLARIGDAEGARSVMVRLPPSRLADAASLLALQGYVALIEGRQREARRFFDLGTAANPGASSMRMLISLETGEFAMNSGDRKFGDPIAQRGKQLATASRTHRKNLLDTCGHGQDVSGRSGAGRRIGSG